MSKAKCPLCGGTVAYQGLNTLECRTVDCDNFCGEEEKEARRDFMWEPGALKITFTKPKLPGFAPVPKKPGSPWPSPATHKRVVKTAHQIKKADDSYSTEDIKKAMDALRKVKIIPPASPAKDDSTVPDLDNSREED